MVNIKDFIAYFFKFAKETMTNVWNETERPPEECYEEETDWLIILPEML